MTAASAKNIATAAKTARPAPPPPPHPPPARGPRATARKSAPPGQSCDVCVECPASLATYQVAPGPEKFKQESRPLTPSGPDVRNRYGQDCPRFFALGSPICSQLGPAKGEIGRAHV